VIHRLAEVDSTMAAARDLPVGDVVVADHQTAGRGRLDRRWDAAPGAALLATFVLPFDRLAVFRCGVAAAEACGAEVRLKWPNDLMLEGRKLGGILAEGRPPDRMLVGIGINLRSAPPGAAALEVDRDELLDRLIVAMHSWTNVDAATVTGRWCELSETLGRDVRVEQGGETIEGIAEDLAPDGALIVGGRRVVAGDVTRLR
jgi:BirA family biotin operon repressor/biotin-[acetyl-CoA-carboxylase] ligase